jgi:hypothetical protein
MLAGMAALFGDRGERVDQPAGKAREIRLVFQQQHPVGLVLQHVLPELRAERCQPFGDLGETFLLVTGKRGTRTHETLPVPLKHA